MLMFVFLMIPCVHGIADRKHLIFFERDCTRKGKEMLLWCSLYWRNDFLQIKKRSIPFQPLFCLEQPAHFLCTGLTSEQWAEKQLRPGGAGRTYSKCRYHTQLYPWQIGPQDRWLGVTIDCVRLFRLLNQSLGMQCPGEGLFLRKQPRTSDCLLLMVVQF